MLSAQQIVALHDRLTCAGHEGSPVVPEDAWLALVARQHQANFELWHIEDEARTPGATDAELAAVKRRVDTTNQTRNDLAEQLDRVLLAWLAGEEYPSGAKAQVHQSDDSARLNSCPATKPEAEPGERTDRSGHCFSNEHSFSGALPNPAAPLHSESPGLIIDRLSILALKIYHTRDEAERGDAPEGHTQRNLERLAVLEEQRNDLAGCLDELWRETLAGKRRFKLYRQLKMYNDPSLNPAVYRKLVK